MRRMQFAMPAGPPPRHSFCALPLHEDDPLDHAPCAVPEVSSAVAWPSTHASTPDQARYAGSPFVARRRFTSARHVARAAA